MHRLKVYRFFWAGFMCAAVFNIAPGFVRALRDATVAAVVARIVGATLVTEGGHS